MRIYFDDVLINEDGYAELTNKYELFNDSFYLGSVASNTFKLKVLKSEVNSHPLNVKIEDENTTFHLITDKVEEDKGFYNYSLVDKMVNFNFNYDASVLIEANGETPTYLSDILEDICLKAGVELNYTITNNIIVTWYDNRIQARDYLSFIAELEGGYACIDELGKLTIKQHKQASKKNISVDDVSELIIGEKKKITRVVYDNGSLKYEFGDETGNTLYLNQNNVFITSEIVVQNIYNKIVDFEFYTITVPKIIIDSSIRAGDVITFYDGENEYQTIAQYLSSYAGGWVGKYEFNINTSKQEETKILGIEEQVLSIRTEIDRTNASLKIKAEEIDENTSKIGSLEITTNGLTGTVSQLDSDVNGPSGLSSKTAQLSLDVNALRGEIGDVTDITATQEGNGILQFDNVNASEPINMIVKPTATEDIVRVFPSPNLYPSPTLFTKSLKMYFHNTTEDETFVYTLPSDLRYFDGVADEFQWDYENQTCEIIRRIGLDSNFDKYVLDEEIIEIYDMPFIFLTTGDYTINIPSFPNVYMKIRLMSQNMYTSQFATKVELKASVEVASTAINLEVSKKVGNNEIISKINQTAEAIKIQAGKIDISGVLTAINNDTTTTIDGNKITTGTLSADKITTGTLNGTNINIINLNASNLNSGRLNITSGNYYLRMGFYEGNNPSVSGLNVGGYGIKAYSGIVATNFGITDSDAGKSGTFILRHSNGSNVVYLTFKGGILTAFSIV